MLLPTKMIDSTNRLWWKSLPTYIATTREMARIAVPTKAQMVQSEVVLVSIIIVFFLLLFVQKLPQSQMQKHVKTAFTFSGTLSFTLYQRSNIISYSESYLKLLVSASCCLLLATKVRMKKRDICSSSLISTEIGMYLSNWFYPRQQIEPIRQIHSNFC